MHKINLVIVVCNYNRFFSTSSTLSMTLAKGIKWLKNSSTSWRQKPKCPTRIFGCWIKCLAPTCMQTTERKSLLFIITIISLDSRVRSITRLFFLLVSFTEKWILHQKFCTIWLYRWLQHSPWRNVVMAMVGSYGTTLMAVVVDFSLLLGRREDNKGRNRVTLDSSSKFEYNKLLFLCAVRFRTIWVFTELINQQCSAALMARVIWRVKVKSIECSWRQIS